MFGTFGTLILALVATMIVVASLFVSYHTWKLMKHTDATVITVWQNSKTVLISTIVLNVFSVALLGLLFAMGSTKG